MCKLYFSFFFGAAGEVKYNRMSAGDINEAPKLLDSTVKSHTTCYVPNNLLQGWQVGVKSKRQEDRDGNENDIIKEDGFPKSDTAQSILESYLVHLVSLVLLGQSENERDGMSNARYDDN
jgi:hypothetical protein